MLDARPVDVRQKFGFAAWQSPRQMVYGKAASVCTAQLLCIISVTMNRVYSLSLHSGFNIQLCIISVTMNKVRSLRLPFHKIYTNGKAASVCPAQLLCIISVTAGTTYTCTCVLSVLLPGNCKVFSVPLSSQTSAIEHWDHSSSHGAIGHTIIRYFSQTIIRKP